MNYFVNLLRAILGLKPNVDAHPKEVVVIKKSTRRYVKDVKPGESIRIEWYRIKSGIGYLKCLNNDPETNKILLEVTWGNHEEAKCEQKEQVILDYNSTELKNFNLLNPIATKEEEDEEFDIATLQKKMNEAIEKEDYEGANEFQKKIDKFLKDKE